MKNILQGKYRLISHGIYDAEKGYAATSEFLNGQICYGADQNLSVLIAFSPDPQGAKDILAYVGTYEIKGSSVFHNISVSSSSQLWNTVEGREFEIEKDRLKLRKVLPEGRVFEAVWEKLK